MKKLYDIAEASPKPKKTYAIGIDLGTTNSLVAATNEDGLVEIITNIPSIVAYDNNIIVGKDAAHTPDAIRSIKRHMGANHAIMTKLGPKTPMEISAEILKALKHDAEKKLSQPITAAVITVPARFDDLARSHTKAAAKLAGIEVLRLLNEPTAAILAYGFTLQDLRVFLVCDIGGGTVDVSIVKSVHGVFEVLATNGDIRLGGDDFDQAVMKYLQQKYSVTIDIMHARNIRESLSMQDQWQGPDFSLSAKELSEILQPFIIKIGKIIKSAVKDAELSLKDIDEVLLVGGASRTVALQKYIADMFSLPSLKPLPTSFSPDEIVAMGASLQAHLLLGGSDKVLLDVTPLSLGVELQGDLLEVLIPKNSLIPTEYIAVYTNAADNQTGMSVNILQGEGLRASECTSLGRFEIKFPKVKKGEARIEIKFKIDLDCLLTVTACDTTTGYELEKVLTIETHLS